MIQKLFATVMFLSLLTACTTNADRLNQMHQSLALKMVSSDLAERVETLHIATPGYRVQTVGRPGAGSHGGNAVFIGLVSDSGGKTLDLPLEYDYTFTLSEGDSKVNVSLIYSPSDEMLRSAIAKALSGK